MKYFSRRILKGEKSGKVAMEAIIEENSIQKEGGIFSTRIKFKGGAKCIFLLRFAYTKQVLKLKGLSCREKIK